MKMKGKKKWIIIAVIVVLAVFGALGNKDKDKALGSDAEPPAAQTEEQSDYEATTGEDQAAEDDTEEVEVHEEEAAGTGSYSTSDAPEGVSPELVEFLDSYEAFMDEYCEFMKNYNESDPTQLLKYASLMEKYYEFSEKAEAWDEENMTDEETLYYIKVMNRVNEKLLETGIAVG